MYAAIWRLLPGPWWLRVLILVVVIAAVLYGLFWYDLPLGVSPIIAPGARSTSNDASARGRQPRQLRAHPWLDT